MVQRSSIIFLGFQNHNIQPCKNCSAKQKKGGVQGPLEVIGMDFRDFTHEKSVFDNKNPWMDDAF